MSRSADEVTVPDGAIEHGTAGQALASSREPLDRFLRSMVNTLPAATQRIVGYHMGWLDADGAAVAGNPGKAIRPTLALLASQAVGATAEAALPAAAAVELVHNFSLLHDDVIDRDTTRRHRPTTWAVFGVGAAILAGDALLALAYKVLAASRHPAAEQAAAMLSEAVLGMIEGQYVDISFEERTDVVLPECIRMSERKTALLMACACALGASFGGGRSFQVEQLRRFGLHLGMAFQIVDDLLGIWGDPAVTGKPVRSDLQTRKKSFPVVVALTSGTAAGAELASLYGRRDPLSGEELVRAGELVLQAGGRAWSEARRDEFLALALADLERASALDRAAAELRWLAFLLTQRDR